MPQRLLISVIGAGRLGGIHAKLLEQGDAALLSGIFDPDAARAEEVSKERNCRIFKTIEEAIADSDACVIAAPTTNHYEIAKSALENSIHCFIEKPITATFDQAKEIINLAESKRLIVKVGHVERFNPALLALRDYKIDPMFVEAHRLSPFRPRAIDVSVIHDLMIHDIDIVMSLIKSDLVKIDANGVSVLTNEPDIANARLTFENGAVANLTASRISAKPMRKMRIFQQNAYLSMDFAKQKTEVFKILSEGEPAPETGTPATVLGSIYDGAKNSNIYYETPEAPEINAIAEEHKAFVAAIAQGEGGGASARDAAKALKVAELIAEKIRQ